MILPVVIVGVFLGGVGGISYALFKQMMQNRRSQIKKSCRSKQQLIQQKRQLEKTFIKLIKQANFTSIINEKQNKLQVCFLGPTSVGKSSLCNMLFGTKEEVGLGQCTKKAKVVYQTQEKTFWDARGTNSEWDDYQQEDVRFFKDIDQVYLLYSGSVTEVRFMAQLLTQMEKQIIFVRTKCDNWKQGQKSIDVTLSQDMSRINEFKVKYKKFIAVGKGMLQAIKQTI